MKRILLGLLTLLLPPVAPKTWLLRCFGWKLSPGSRIGFSWVYAGKVEMGARVRIGHLNFINVRFIVMKERSYIGHLNRVVGPLGLILRPQAALGTRNTVRRSAHPIVWGTSVLRLGILSKLTYGHFVDCTRPVLIDDYSTLAGVGSQIWTHGYFHAPEGPDRFRVDGCVRIGHNVYIGSSCVVNAGVSIAPAVTVGSHVCISKSLERAGLYVAQPMRLIETDYAARVSSGRPVNVQGLVEKVFAKKTR